MASKSIKPNIILEKSIFQARYKPKVDFYDTLVTAAKLFEGKYKQWRTDRLLFQFYDYVEHCNVIIAYDSFSYEQDSSNSTLEQDNIEYMLKDLPGTLGITSYLRLGLRRYYLIPVHMPFDKLVTVLNSKLFSQDKGLLEFMPHSTDDLKYVINASDGDDKLNVTIGPVCKSEIPQYIRYNKDNHLKPETRESDYLSIIEKYPDVGVFVDVDFHNDKGEYPKDKVKTFVQTASKKINMFIENLRNYLFEV